MKSNSIDPNMVPQIELANGDMIPCIGMGTFGSDRFSAEEVSDAVAGALRYGYRLFDCAAVYGNEDLIGQVFKDAMDDTLVAREELYITSKVWNDMHGQGDVLLSMAQTLKDLQFDYVDAFFMHWPFPNYHAPGADIDDRSPDAVPFSADQFIETWQQLERLVDMGLTKTIGMSNMTIPKLEAVLPHCRIKPTVIEMELHPSFQQKELFDYCVEHKIQPIGFSPLGSPTRPDRDMMDGDVADMEMPEIKKIAEDHGVHPALIALKWAVQRGQIPIPFSIHQEQYENNLKAVTEDPLTEKEMKVMETLERDSRLIKGHVFLWEGANDWRDLWDEDGTITK